MNIFVVPEAPNSYSARGTELLQFQGHGTFVVPGVWNFCGARGTIILCCHNSGVGSHKVSQVFYFSLLQTLSRPQLEHPNFNCYITIVKLQLPSLVYVLSGV